jgi:hypothetical protein
VSGDFRVEEADELYREIRIENSLTDKNGNKVRLKKGAEVDVNEADKSQTVPKNSGGGESLERGAGDCEISLH